MQASGTESSKYTGKGLCIIDFIKTSQREKRYIGDEKNRNTSKKAGYNILH